MYLAVSTVRVSPPASHAVVDVYYVIAYLQRYSGSSDFRCGPVRRGCDSADNGRRSGGRYKNTLRNVVDESGAASTAPIRTDLFGADQLKIFQAFQLGFIFGQEKVSSVSRLRVMSSANSSVLELRLRRSIEAAIRTSAARWYVVVEQDEGRLAAVF